MGQCLSSPEHPDCVLISEVRIADMHRSVHQYELFASAYSPKSKEQWTLSFNSLKSIILQAFIRTFLPVGFPDSVRPEYIEYQWWDSLQALCSYLRSVLTLQAILTGAGVGNAEASALATTLAWVMKDGVGMLGSLLFAYLCSDLFEINVKEWRLVADILCNVALTVDMLVSFLPNWFLELTSISSICKACCGLVAGATRARISSHFAHKGHLADVTAKESTQETAVTLLGLGLGLIVTKVVADNKVFAWGLFFFLMVLHQYANYELVRVLVLDTLNPQRIYLIVDNVEKNRLKDRSTASLLPTPQDIAVTESIYRPIWLAFYGPQLGCSIAAVLNTLQNVSVATAEPIPVLWHRLLSVWENEKFVISIDMSCRPLILLEENSNEADYVKAYSIACYFMYSWTKLSSGMFVSSTNITKRVQSITTSGASDGLIWYEKNVLRPGLAKYGWEVGVGKARLGEGTWRFCRSSSYSIESDKKE